MSILFTDKIRSSDSEIVEGFWRRDGNAVRLAEIKYSKYIFTVCNNLLGNREDSEECVNDTLKHAWDTIPPNRPASLKAYLGILAHSIATDRLRKKTSRKRAGIDVALDDFADFLSDEQLLCDEEANGRLTEILNSFLESLPRNERICFIKRYYFAYSADKIAEQTGTSRSTVFEKLRSAKEKLRIILEKEGYLK